MAEISLPSYKEQNFTPIQAANKLANYFSAISQTVQPLNESEFHPALQLTLHEGRTGPKPVLEEHGVYRKILRDSKPNSSVPGDIPKPLISKYPFQYSVPATRIFNNIIQSGKWPRQWVQEHAVVISKLEKSRLPSSEEDLRTISKTSWLSKILRISWVISCSQLLSPS